MKTLLLIFAGSFLLCSTGAAQQIDSDCPTTEEAFFKSLELSDHCKKVAASRHYFRLLEHAMTEAAQRIKRTTLVDYLTPKTPRLVDDLYPNPASDSALLEVAPGSSRVDIQVFDLSGRQVRTVFSGIPGPSGQQVPIDVSNLAPGAYPVRATSRSGQSVQMLIVR